ncbi:MAG: hypothetical protein WAW73_20480 [Rhodoferax sp.]
MPTPTKERIEHLVQWMRGYIRDNPVEGESSRLVMHMDFQVAVHALPDGDQAIVVDALRKLKPVGWAATLSPDRLAPGLFSVHLAGPYRAVAGRDGDRMFLLALE